MLKSFNYAAYTALFTHVNRRPEQSAGVHCAKFWEQEMSALFLDSYRQVAKGSAFLPADTSAFATLLNIFALEEAVYELRDEINHRPAWIRIPVRAIVDVLESGNQPEAP